MRSYDVEMVPTDNGPWCLKSEVDAYIRHHKYKRCLAMARLCRARYNEWAAYYPTTTTRKMRFLYKWEKRWLKIAEKFKEAK